VRQIQDDDTKLVQLEINFRDCALARYMILEESILARHKNTLAEIRLAVIDEFKKPKSESQCIVELKEIKQAPGESVWDFYQRFKVLRDWLSFNIPDEQHREWFIVTLLPHIWLPIYAHQTSFQALLFFLTHWY
jgi:hypothetical protein